MTRPGERRAEPFLKWAGGKRQLLQQFEKYFPAANARGTYHEPFLGGGAVFFHLRPQMAVLTDTNEELIDCYRAVRDDVESVVRELSVCRNEAGFFYEMRARDPRALTSAARAARTIFMNRTCFNGLYRVNRAGLFNVPFGRYKTDTFRKFDVLRTAAAALAGAVLEVRPFRAVLDSAKEGDFVYFDPPYQPLSTTSSFTAYTRDSFGEAEQAELAEVFRELDGRGCRVMLSNSDTRFIRGLFSHYRIETVLAARAINSKTTARGRIPEVLVMNEACRRVSSASA